MAVLRAGFLGGISGKIAGAVGARWKNVNYIRAHVKPANPNTDAQKAKRLRFKTAAQFLQGLVGNIFNIYVDPFLRGMSGYNWAMRTNIKVFDTNTPDLSTIKICHGTLFAASFVSCGVAAGTISIVYSDAIGGNGKTTDLVYACAYDSAASRWYFAPAEALRSAAAIAITVPLDFVASGSAAFLVTCRRDVSNFVRQSSDSQYMAVSP